MSRARRPLKPGAARSFETRPAAAAIGEALQLRGLSEEIRRARLLTEWTELVGARIAARTKPDGIHERTLYIEVESSAWLHELNLLRPQLLRGLLDRLGLPRLFDDIRFRLIGRTGRTRPTVPPSRAIPPYIPPPTAPAGIEHRAAIARDVAGIEDEDLRALIARVRIANDR